MSTARPTSAPATHVAASIIVKDGRTLVRDSTAASATAEAASAGDGVGAATKRSEEVADDVKEGRGMDHEGSVSSSAGTHTHAKSVVASTQWRTAADRRCRSAVAASPVSRSRATLIVMLSRRVIAPHPFSPSARTPRSSLC